MRVKIIKGAVQKKHATLCCNDGLKSGIPNLPKKINSCLRASYGLGRIDVWPLLQSTLSVPNRHVDLSSLRLFDRLLAIALPDQTRALNSEAGH